jgi:hypothetical protein
MEGLHPPHIRKKISKQKSSNIQPQHPHIFFTSKLIICNQNQDISLQAIIWYIKTKHNFLKTNVFHFELENTFSLLQFETSKLNPKSWCLKTKGTKIYGKQNCPKIVKLYQFAWYLTLWSFQPVIASSYKKVEKLKKLWLNMQTQMSKYVVKWFCSWFFMKAKLLKVFSPSMEPKTWTIAISANFLYSLNLCIRTTDFHP